MVVEKPIKVLHKHFHICLFFGFFYQTHNSTLFRMSPKFLACDTSWTCESIFSQYHLTNTDRIQVFVEGIIFFCQSSSKINCFQRFVQNTSPFLLFQTQNLNFCLALITFLATV